MSNTTLSQEDLNLMSTQDLLNEQELLVFKAEKQRWKERLSLEPSSYQEGYLKDGERGLNLFARMAVRGFRLYSTPAHR